VNNKYSLKELVRNNCKCVFPDCESCHIEKHVALAVKEWLTQKRHETLPHKITNESSDAKIINKFINELLGEL
jgi:hypothetical protein